MQDKSSLFSKNKIYFTSLGCARNLVDSEVMIGLLLRAGYELTPELKKADFCIVNTCGFLQAAREEALEVFQEIFSYKKKKAKVIAVGCMVQKYPHILKENFPQLHYLLGSGDAEKILEAVQSCQAEEKISSQKSYLQWGEVPRFLTTPKHYAYLKIAEGCRKQCSFCIIPHIKGKLKSKGEEQVLKEFRSLLSQGVYEIILIAQDLGDYGKDRAEKRALHGLLQKMLDDPRDFWIRLLYLYPDEIDDPFLDLMCSDPRICPYLDMPIQHINDQILKRMHRKTSKKQILKTLEKLRHKIPAIAIRTSLMVGFPGETEEQFEEILSFVRQARLSHIGVFSYSKEEESYSAGLKGHLPIEVKEERRQRLMQEQLSIVQEENQKQQGARIAVLIEGFHPDSSYLMQARSQKQCPDIDGVVILNDFEVVPEVSKLYEVEITSYADYDLIGKVIRPLPRKRVGKLSLAPQTLVS